MGFSAQERDEKRSSVWILTSEMLDKTTARQFIAPRRQDAKAQSDAPRHFDPFDKAQDKLREKSFLDPSHSLGMTGRGHVTWRLCVFAGVISFPIL
jgi:hypothetical protein